MRGTFITRAGEQDAEPDSAPVPDAPAPDPAARLIALQRSAGNAATTALLQRQNGTALNTRGAAYLDLAQGDAAKAAIVEKLIEEGHWSFGEVQELSLGWPAVLLNQERAEMTLQWVHRAAGTLDEARWAAARAAADNAAYLRSLLFLQLMKTALPGAHPGDPKLELLAAYADALTSPLLAARAATIVEKAAGLGPAKAELDATRPFGFDPAMARPAEQAAKFAADDARADELQDLATQEKAEKDTALAATRPGVEKDLTRRERNKGDVEKTIKDKMATAAKPAIDLITQDYSGRRAALPPVEQTDAYRGVHDAYAAYSAGVGHHKDAPAALAKAGHDFAVATSIVKAIQAEPGFAAVALRDDVTLPTVKNLLALPGGDLSALVTYLPPDRVGSFALKPERLAIGLALQRAGVPQARGVAVAQHWPVLQSYGQYANELADLAALVTAFQVADVVGLLEGMYPKQAAAGKLNALETLRPIAASLQVLRHMVERGTAARWNAATLVNVLGALPNGSLAAAVDQAVSAELSGARLHDRDTEFADWIKDIALLLAIPNSGVTVTARQTVNLSGGTLEAICDVGGIGRTFVIHEHPGATGPKAGAAYASDYHVKPVRGNTQTPRVKRDDIPPALYQRLPHHL